MNTDFKDLMSQRTDEDLIKIVFVDRDNYQALAVEAAEEEIKKREIDAIKIEQVKDDLRAQIKAKQNFDAKKVGASTRLINFIIDTIAIVILTMIFTYIIALFTNPADQDYMTILIFFMYIPGSFVYYVFMETKFQKTIGKFITKTTVVNKNGTRPELGEIISRTLCRYIPFDRISFLFSPNGFHDRLTNTTVIKDEN